ncbi:MAG: ornithine carbamoyltransferase [Deltaproteobacteria bacterium RIFCSPLOWO2_02_FULL_50_16]|nr:MAG: ornithine carbamoyltransferase [Deltaproteobacteria bacterium GWA2_50_8]OGQ25877.1 MAG: ornithine carbamoyltransferase [Deltaproteobacteria bacterium RIFCSPHIGHO2_02_FULL_50_15]OGQ56999.1 MAG: ornithine carbamoyltransferase [Deltaproteobacteria bacterium RIFCSPLOWO2_02_FULL_50_16]OGQ66088.1 MAG: ornithine carbamoyltransferase [Deltaproteobacteria bacterium RIFCSPLOWO2_12_FULL_50_11]
MKKDLLSLLDLSHEDIEKILSRAAFYKKNRKKRKNATLLKGQSIALIFEKASTRTKVSFSVAIHQLGGHVVELDEKGSQLGRGETYMDTARVLAGYVDAIVCRTYAQNNLEQMAHSVSIPVINALSDLYHPCQVLADLLTLQGHKRNFLDQKVVYLGDGNNMANTWITAAMVLGFPLVVATPRGFEPPAAILKHLHQQASDSITLLNDPYKAVQGADVIYTDTWFSMGQEVSREKKEAFQGFQVNQELLKKANKNAIVLHCLPAHRNEEITSEVMDGPQSRIFEEAENRLYVQKAILEIILLTRNKV